MAGQIVKSFDKGKTTYVFHDDFCQNKTAEDIKSALERIAEIAYPELKKNHHEEKIADTA